ncbi:MAG: PEP/pyruvate-binding domain-containing protein [Nitrospirota bacterium]|jgi:pyruvate,water dikinase
MKPIIHFDDPEALDPDVVGHKFRSLARAHRAGFRVPTAVAVPAEAHRIFSERRTWPDGLWEEIRRSVGALDLSNGISVRSSATQEDLDDTSFAGQYETHLDIRSLEELREKVQACWTSAESPVVRSYLEQRGRPNEQPHMAVVLQRMIHPRCAGVAFSRDPVAPAAGDAVVEYVPGLGEDLVSGHATPHRARVQTDGTVLVEAVEGAPSTVELSDDQWREIVALARKAERNAQVPQDVEWAMDDAGRLWLLQSRAITTLGEADLQCPPGVWTRKIADDLWADRLTPFLADGMLRSCPRWDLSRIGRLIGLPVIQPTLAVIDGFLYVNMASVAAAAAFIPSRLKLANVEALFPPGYDRGRFLSPSGFRRLSVGIRSLLLGVKEPQSLPFLCRSLTRRKMKVLGRDLAQLDRMESDAPNRTLEKIRAGLELLTQAQVTNQFPYFYATVFTWSLSWLVEQVAHRDHGLFLRLISGDSQNVTVEIEHAFRRIAERMAADPELAARLASEQPISLTSLPDEIRTLIEDFLNRYGCRARHRTLAVKRWDEAPQEILGMLRGLITAGAKGSGTQQDQLQDAARGRQTTLPYLRELPWKVRPVARLALGATRRFLDLREDLRFFLDQVLFLLRRSLLELGKQTGLGELVFFLTDAELGEMVSGGLTIDEAQALAERRQAQFMRPGAAATFLVDGRRVEPASSSDGALHGVGASPGRVAGRVRIVEDPTKDTIQQGEILVARNTDPGWTPILSKVAGIVVEEGGLLNHCSIVARELGIPAVVGLRRATQVFRDGDRLVIDGGLGMAWLERA